MDAILTDPRQIVQIRHHTPMTTPLTNAAKRELKARAQRLEPILKVGHAGITPEFLAGLDRALDDHGLVKVRFGDFKEQKKTLAPMIAEKSGSELVTRVGNVAVFHRHRAKDAEAVE